MAGDFLAKLFGANWRTSLSGVITLATAAISAKPEIINWLPQSWQTYLRHTMPRSVAQCGACGAHLGLAPLRHILYAPKAV